MGTQGGIVKCVWGHRDGLQGVCGDTGMGCKACVGTHVWVVKCVWGHRHPIRIPTQFNPQQCSASSWGADPSALHCTFALRCPHLHCGFALCGSAGEMQRVKHKAYSAKLQCRAQPPRDLSPALRAAGGYIAIPSLNPFFKHWF